MPLWQNTMQQKSRLLVYKIQNSMKYGKKAKLNKKQSRVHHETCDFRV